MHCDSYSQRNRDPIVFLKELPSSPKCVDLRVRFHLLQSVPELVVFAFILAWAPVMCV